MRRGTEWIVKIAAIAMIAYFGWMLMEKAILWPWQERDLRIRMEQALRQCQGELQPKK
jgi:hypothetical protein